jgi:SAM-dependent methyltransferase
MVPDYTGVDISESVRAYLHKPFYRASATELPFEDNSFDAIWSYAVLEHVPDPERSLREMRRVLKQDGLLLLGPAWQCRPWAAKGYPVRPYSDFDLFGKVVKASIPVRDSVFFRSCYIFPKRLIRSIEFFLKKEPLRFRYKELKPNYEHFWMSDSDAANSMDPYEAVLWFVSRGDECPNYPGWLNKFFVRTGALVFRIKRRNSGPVAASS